MQAGAAVGGPRWCEENGPTGIASTVWNRQATCIYAGVSKRRLRWRIIEIIGPERQLCGKLRDTPCLIESNLYATRRKIACLAGMVPSEWSTGDDQRRGSITKVGVPAIRRIITEMVWRIIQFQPQYPPVQKWQEVLRGTNRTLKKKAAVAIGRQLMVDLWRMETGRVTAQELNLVMVGA